MECTFNRVGAEYHDQLTLSGHYERIADLDRFAGLGIRAMRFPVLWERVAPDGLPNADWGWVDARLARLRELGIEPIVGLVHHGSGPRHTSLVDPGFANGLAEFARAVAERYPWVTRYTPVNEPLTTARFSGLYGHWYPHGREDRLFAAALLQQCRAVVLAMQAIRKVTPAAQLVQTEDLGKTYSTPALAYQAEFENERRWTSFDLLCGRLGPDQLMGEHFCRHGVSVEDLTWFREHPCPPNVLGINHYLSAERFLDDRLERYPVESHGGNGRQPYADVLALRVLADGVAGPAGILSEAWQRYHLPLAITEAHNGCTREEQLRWLWEVWQAAQAVRAAGADVRAVTVWSLLGVYDWDQLVTRFDGHYESGVFDLRAPEPRPTALAGLMRELATGQVPEHPVLASPGWWRRPERLFYPAVRLAATEAQAPIQGRKQPARPVVITGAGGVLGHAFTRLCRLRGLACRPLPHEELDIADPAAVDAALRALQPWAVVNAAGYSEVDAAEQDEDACFRANTTGAAVLAAACAGRGVSLVTLSSDLVFDGRPERPWLEGDQTGPGNVYGRSKAAMEERVLAAFPGALVVRPGPVFGALAMPDVVTNALRALARGEGVAAPDDVVVSPTYLPDLAHACLDLLIDGAAGIWHLANAGATTWADFLHEVAALAGMEAARIERRSLVSFQLAAARPPYRALGSERGTTLPALEDAMTRYVEEALCTLGSATRRGQPIRIPAARNRDSAA